LRFGTTNRSTRGRTNIDSRDIIKKLEAEGWKLDRVNGSHHHFRHLSKPGTVTVPHPQKDLATGTVRSIYRQAALPWPPR
jgi:predicted RNA binding protein YcfA (HicA-like mRNA interferase family)